MSNKLFFVSSNKNKHEEVKEILRPLNVEQLSVELIEPQAKTFEDVVMFKISQLLPSFGDKHLVVEDSGIVIDSLCSKEYEFPGIYSKHVFHTIGLRGVLQLLEGKKNRNAKMVCVVAYYNPTNKSIMTFRGEIEGRISKEIRGKEGFGFDPIFIPHGHNETFAENINIKMSVSHRKEAFSKLKYYLLGEYKITSNNKM